MNQSCNGFLEEYSDKQVLYSGRDFDMFGIKNGNYYSHVIVQLLNELESHINEEISLSCLYTGKCDSCTPNVTVPNAIRIIVDKLCTLTSNDIIYNGDKYCIGDDSISPSAVYLLGKSVKYSVSPASNGTSISYDATDIIRDLPKEYRVDRINATIAGKPKLGKSIILDSNKSYVGATIENDRFPINLDLSIRVSSENGDVRLSKTISIPSPKSGEYYSQLNVQDYGSVSNKAYNLETFLSSVAAQTCANKTELESFRNIDLPGCDGFTFGSRDIKDIIAQFSSLLCEFDNRLKTMENVSYSVPDGCCASKSVNESCGSAIGTLAGVCSGLRDEINSIKYNL